MLETVREYAAERLEESGEAKAIRLRHARHYMALAEASEPAWYGAQEASWFDRLEGELDNLRAALAWTTEGSARVAEVALRLAGALGRFWNVRGPLSEGRAWLAAALATEGAGAPDLDRWRANALMWAGWLAYYQGDDRAAHAPLSESVALWRRLGDARGLAWALGHQAIALSRHDLPRARSLMDRVVVFSGRVDDPALLGRALAANGGLTMRAGNLDQARAMVEKGLALAEESQALDTLAYATRLLGEIALSQGDYASARSAYQESLTLFREAKVQPGIANRLCDLGDLWTLEGDCDRAGACYRESLELRRKIGLKGAVVSTLVRVAYVALRQDDLAEARAHLADGLGLGREMTQIVERTECACLLGGAGLAEAQGRPERAARLLGAVDAAWERGIPPLTALCPHVYRDLLAAIRAQLDEAAFAAAWDEGRAMSEEEDWAWRELQN
jgi:tetratricopeptide (TPR) repeat protein